MSVGEIVQSPPIPKFCQVVRHPVRSVTVPYSLVVVAYGWPCWLPSISALQLPLSGGYFPSRLHKYFPSLPSWSPPKLMSTWSQPVDFMAYTSKSRAFPASVCLLLSGSTNFLKQVISRLQEHPGPFVFAVDAPFETLTRRNLLRARTELVKMCTMAKFRCAVVTHSDFDGATNASHLVIFRGVDLTGFHPPVSMPRVPKHLLNSAAPGRAKTQRSAHDSDQPP